MWQLPNGTIIRKPKQIIIDNVTHPQNIFLQWSVEELNAVGIYPIIDQIYNAQRYRAVSSNESTISGTIYITYDLEERPEYLAYYKNSACTEINEKRKNQMNAGVEYLDHTWDSDDTAKANVMGIILAYSTGVMPQEATIVWRTKDNQNVELTRDQLIGLSATILAHVESVYSSSWQLKDAINNCNSVEEINNVLAGQ